MLVFINYYSIFIYNLSLKFPAKIESSYKANNTLSKYHLNDNETTKSYITDNYSTQCTDHNLMYSLQLQSLLFSL